MRGFCSAPTGSPVWPSDGLLRTPDTQGVGFIITVSAGDGSCVSHCEDCFRHFTLTEPHYTLMIIFSNLYVKRLKLSQVQ